MHAANCNQLDSSFPLQNMQLRKDSGECNNISNLGCLCRAQTKMHTYCCWCVSTSPITQIQPSLPLGIHGGLELCSQDLAGIICNLQISTWTYRESWHVYLLPSCPITVGKGTTQQRCNNISAWYLGFPDDLAPVSRSGMFSAVVASYLLLSNPDHSIIMSRPLELQRRVPLPVSEM